MRTDDGLGALRGAMIAAPAGLAMWAAVGWAIWRWLR